MLIDMHSHSTFSDGTYTPQQLIEMAVEKKLEIYSITDHDNIGAQEFAINFSKEKKLNYVTGVEISCEFSSMLDILGYRIDIKNIKLNKVLNEIQDFRENRNVYMIEKLKKIGIEISMNELKQVAGSKIIGRPHFARVMVNKNYVKSFEEAFEKYLGDGKPGNVPKKKIKPLEAIELIRNAGGYPVIAHPRYLNLNKDRFEQFLKEMKKNGLWGLETYYSKNTVSENKYYYEIAKKYELIPTAGSDFHGLNKPDIKIGMEVTEEITNNIKKYFWGE
ncbi:phosphatase [Tepiditoga spiralis]|uniref:Phosphatase n=1 Tax=Tepiditoga spiralis TaxID=2108365 RepID=A0A7G1G7K6_9BACT|nr:PHP domain-containing protein [Tepiditoga spiralis]BBE31346.1 phosphatase [Tepiditoga spiralis]